MAGAPCHGTIGTMVNPALPVSDPYSIHWSHSRLTFNTAQGHDLTMTLDLSRPDGRSQNIITDRYLNNVSVSLGCSTLLFA